MVDRNCSRCNLYILVSFLLIAIVVGFPAFNIQKPLWWAPYIQQVPLTEERPVFHSPKRQHRDLANWPLCPSNVDRVECFYTYLTMYVKLQDKVDGSAQSRTVGKRSHGNLASEDCPPGTTPEECAFYQLKLENGLDKE